MFYPYDATAEGEVLNRGMALRCGLELEEKLVHLLYCEALAQVVFRASLDGALSNLI